MPRQGPVSNTRPSVRRGILLAAVWSFVVVAACYDAYFAWREQAALDAWEVNPVAAPGRGSAGAADADRFQGGWHCVRPWAGRLLPLALSAARQPTDNGRRRSVRTSVRLLCLLPHGRARPFLGSESLQASATTPAFCCGEVPLPSRARGQGCLRPRVLICPWCRDLSFPPSYYPPCSSGRHLCL